MIFVQTRLNLEPRQNIDTSSWPRKSPRKICRTAQSASVIQVTKKKQLSNQKKHMSVTTSRTDITVLTLSYSFYFGTRPLDILIHNNRNSSGRCRIKHPLSLSSKSRRHKNLGNLKTNIILTSFCIFGLLSHLFYFSEMKNYAQTPKMLSH